MLPTSIASLSDAECCAWQVTRYMSCGDAAQYLGPEAEAALGLWCNKPTAQTTEEPPSEKITQLEDRNADEGVVDCDGDDEWDVGDEEDDGDGGDLGMSSMTFCTRMRRRGFLRDRKLGLWLRLLWERSSGHPNTRRQLLSAAEDHCDAGLWREALASVCERLGRSRHIRPHEALPVYGGSTVVFKLGQMPLSSTARPVHAKPPPPPPPPLVMLTLCLVAPLLGWRCQGPMMRRKGNLSQACLQENSAARRAASW